MSGRVVGGRGRGTIVSAQVSAHHHPQVAPFLALAIFVEDEDGRWIGTDTPHFYANIEDCVAATAHLFTAKERDQGHTLRGLEGREVEFEHSKFQLGFDLASLRVLP